MVKLKQSGDKTLCLRVSPFFFLCVNCVVTCKRGRLTSSNSSQLILLSLFSTVKKKFQLPCCKPYIHTSQEERCNLFYPFDLGPPRSNFGTSRSKSHVVKPALEYY